MDLPRLSFSELVLQPFHNKMRHASSFSVFIYVLELSWYFVSSDTVWPFSNRITNVHRPTQDSVTFPRQASRSIYKPTISGPTRKFEIQRLVSYHSFFSLISIALAWARRHFDFRTSNYKRPQLLPVTSIRRRLFFPKVLFHISILEHV